MNLFKMKQLRYSLYFLIINMFFISCDSVLEEGIDEGKYMFWSNFDGPPIDIFIENIHYGTIELFYGSNPGCDADGCVTVILPVGVYEFTAIEQSNSSGNTNEWNGTFTIKSSTCGALGLSP